MTESQLVQNFLVISSLASVFLVPFLFLGIYHGIKTIFSNYKELGFYKKNRNINYRHIPECVSLLKENKIHYYQIATMLVGLFVFLPIAIKAF